jgi:osmotically-inducible protein OsmY
MAMVMACRRPPPPAAGFAGGRFDRLGNSWITTTIRAQYFAAPEIKRWNVDVTTTGRGQVILRGEVGGAEDRGAAVRIARATEGVKVVEDLLRVTATAATKAIVQPPERRDLWLTTRIQAKYFVDTKVGATNIDVGTREGIVTLHGTVGALGIRRQAVALARNTAGVRDVRDELTVGSALIPSVARAGVAEIDDAWIATMIRSKYFLDPDVKAQPIAVSVADAVVSLSGTVESELQSTTAVQIAGETAGVTGIRNYLRIPVAQPE